MPCVLKNITRNRCVFIQLNRLTTLLLVILSIGCGKTSDTLNDFTSDGCSLFPDRSLIENSDWCECCLEHDIAYWQGGTKAQRLKADRKLRDCVLARTGNKALAEAMYQGVRLGGSPYFYNWYRWGYGWSYKRKYQRLTLEEQRMASDKLFQYFNQAKNSGTPCD